MCFQHLAVAEIHVHAAGQAGIEAAHGTHNVDALEFIGAVLLKDRRVLHSVFVWPRGAIESRGFAFQGVGGYG